jgi:hypothetical protein
MPETEPIVPTPVPTEKPVFVSIEIDVTIEGLENQDIAEIQLLPGMEITADALASVEKTLPRLTVSNEVTKVSAKDIPTGMYMLMVYAPPSYFREPQGYLFRVSETGVVLTSDLPFRFKLIPPSAQKLPPCRDFGTKNDTLEATSTTAAGLPSESQQEVCMAEGIIDLSSPRNQLRPEGQGTSGILAADYHYAGPKTFQDNKGVWGRNYVVDPNVTHDGSANQFVAERVYADNGTKWIEAGWSEDSWKDERQYIYVMDSVGYTSIYFPQYQISRGSAVRTEVYYNSSVNKWRALYYIGNSQWAVLREVSLGFTTADNGYNRGEAYTANGIHPILPPSGFDEGYLSVNGVWSYWDTRYATDVREDPPYECDMLTQYYRFNIHSPVIYLPLVIKN